MFDRCSRRRVAKEQTVMNKRANKNAATVCAVAHAYITQKLAEDVREKLRADGVPAEVIEGINEDNVAEILENIVEGDVVFDDAATHKWFRKALSKHRDTCIKLDESDEFAHTTVISLCTAWQGYDVLFDSVVGGGPHEVGVMGQCRRTTILFSSVASTRPGVDPHSLPWSVRGLEGIRVSG
jgi:hypothetical protein